MSPITFILVLVNSKPKLLTDDSANYLELGTCYIHFFFPLQAPFHED